METEDESKSGGVAYISIGLVVAFTIGVILGAAINIGHFMSTYCMPFR